MYVLFSEKHFMFEVIADYHTKRRKQGRNDPERIRERAPRAAPGIRKLEP